MAGNGWPLDKLSDWLGAAPICCRGFLVAKNAQRLRQTRSGLIASRQSLRLCRWSSQPALPQGTHGSPPAAP